MNPWKTYRENAPFKQYVTGERGQSPLLYMASPYLEFLDLGEYEGLSS